MNKKPTIAYVDIENAHTQEVISVKVPIISYDETKEFKFDISGLSEHELKALEDAINSEFDYTDIEMYYINSEPGIPNFGPDYEYHIQEGILIGNYIRDDNIK